MRKYTALMIVLIAFSTIAGCASMATPKTLDEQIYYAGTAVIAVNNSAASLLERNRISKTDAINVLNKTNEVQSMIAIARAMNLSGDKEGAQKTLSAAQAMLLELEQYLQQQENK